MYLSESSNTPFPAFFFFLLPACTTFLLGLVASSSSNSDKWSSTSSCRLRGELLGCTLVKEGRGGVRLVCGTMLYEVLGVSVVAPDLFRWFGR